MFYLLDKCGGPKSTICLSCTNCLTRKYQPLKTVHEYNSWVKGEDILPFSRRVQTHTFLFDPPLKGAFPISRAGRVPAGVQWLPGNHFSPDFVLHTLFKYWNCLCVLKIAFAFGLAIFSQFLLSLSSSFPCFHNCSVDSRCNCCNQPARGHVNSQRSSRDLLHIPCSTHTY